MNAICANQAANVNKLMLIVCLNTYRNEKQHKYVIGGEM